MDEDKQYERLIKNGHNNTTVIKPHQM